MTRTEPDPPYPTFPDVLRASRRLRGHARSTPLEVCASLSAAAGAEVHLKMENLQRTGSFKIRGALNALGSLSAAERARGVVTASAGNHGLGVSLAAGELGVAATVFVPTTAARTKRDRISRNGASLREVDGSYDDAHQEAERFAASSGAVYVHAYSDPAVVAGQGTVGLEILTSLPATSTLVVPVGGGGLIGGVGIVARALSPSTRVVGVQSTATPAMHASLLAGEVVLPAMGDTLCEGLSGEVDERSFGLARLVVDEMVLVEEGAVRDAIRRLYVEEGLVAEGSGAVGAAAVWSGLVPADGGPIVVVITGGNIDGKVLASILSEAA